MDSGTFCGSDYCTEIMRIFNLIKHNNKRSFAPAFGIFEDIVNLDSMAIQEFTKQVDPKDLAIAIKGSTQEVAECIFSNISTRARESLQADIEYLHNVRMRDVEAAQQNIVATIRRLEQEQIITISHGGGGDEVIA